jgi:hypothetical protein
MSLWKTWSDVWDMMVAEVGLTRTWSWWTMHRRRAIGSLGIKVPDVLEKGKCMFNPRNQSSLEESHICKCKSLLNQDIKWRGDQKWKLIKWFEVFQIITSKSQCQSKITCGNLHEVKKSEVVTINIVQTQVEEIYFIFNLDCRHVTLSRGIPYELLTKSQYSTKPKILSEMSETQ